MLLVEHLFDLNQFFAKLKEFVALLDNLRIGPNDLDAFGLLTGAATAKYGVFTIPN